MHITGGKFNSRKLISPKGDNVRPTLSKTRAAIFDILKQYLDFEGKSFLDMFAGSGIMGIEAASRGFGQIWAIEKDKKTFYNIKANYKLLGLHPNVILGDSIKKIASIDEKFDVIYVDPPYNLGLYNPIVKQFLTKNILNKSGIIVFEHLLKEDIDFSGMKIIKQKNYADKVITFTTI